jgi:vacuolar-type H+-ATPase subunit I/STV1
MFMFLATFAFVLLVVSNFLGIFMLLVGTGLLFSTVWRRTGQVILAAGTLGALLGVGVLGIALHWNLLPDAGQALWAMCAAAGFGWASLFAVGAATVLMLLRQPARWVDRKRAHR